MHTHYKFPGIWTNKQLEGWATRKLGIWKKIFLVFSRGVEFYVMMKDLFPLSDFLSSSNTVIIE
jgi:hypothetical protein